MKNNETKQKVMDAACQLFYSKGYHGTSVRDIAKKASVNVSLINYYFKSKQGLLESAVVFYYEAYLIRLEHVLEETEYLPAIERLKQFVEVIIQYKHEQHQFTCFILRELTIDSVFVREMMVTYLAKENHFISKLFGEVMAGSKHSHTDRKFLLLQLKGLLITPYMSPNDSKNREIWGQDPDQFVTKYSKTIHQWIDYIANEHLHSYR
ncbi:forespore capture DNA-binding protein RefZ [Radiobacillus sp. PE A8.2]|uniref:forespore capture DNA-binding protein RefZ n=1 Tax=Radiobacillus sp. PE A8.2 TaxID=3380349 RepID=UPI00388DE670